MVNKGRFLVLITMKNGGFLSAVLSTGNNAGFLKVLLITINNGGFFSINANNDE